MSANAIAQCILFLAKRDIRNIIVTVNPLTYVLFPIKEVVQAAYFRLFLKKKTTVRQPTAQSTVSRQLKD